MCQEQQAMRQAAQLESSRPSRSCPLGRLICNLVVLLAALERLARGQIVLAPTSRGKLPASARSESTSLFSSCENRSLYEDRVTMMQG